MLTAYSVEPSLPFVLLDRNAVANAVAPDDAAAPTAAATVIARLDLLHGLVEQTRVEVLALRELNHQLLDLVAPAAVEGPQALRVRLLGAFEMRVGGRAIEGWRSRKPRQLLAYLAFDPDRPVARETLIETFWPESEPARGANNLSIAVHHIRTRLGELLPDGRGESRGLSVQQGLYRLAPELPWDVDVHAFRAHVNAGNAALAAGRIEETRERLTAAIEVYRGELLESDLAEEWALEPREALGGLFQSAASWLAAERRPGRRLAAAAAVRPAPGAARRWRRGRPPLADPRAHGARQPRVGAAPVPGLRAGATRRVRRRALGAEANVAARARALIRAATPRRTMTAPASIARQSRGKAAPAMCALGGRGRIVSRRRAGPRGRAGRLGERAAW